MGGMEVWVDGARVIMSRAMSYKAMMYSDVPNLASSFGYTNASWTLKSDLTAEYVCRLLKHMDAGGYARCTPRKRGQSNGGEPAVDFSSGYIQGGKGGVSKQGPKRPREAHQK